MLPPLLESAALSGKAVIAALAADLLHGGAIDEPAVYHMLVAGLAAAFGFLHEFTVQLRDNPTSKAA